MAHAKAMLGEEELDLLRQLQEADRVGDGSPVLPCSAANLFMGETKFAAEPLIGVSRFNGIQVLTLDILNEGELQHLWLGNILDNNRDLGDAGHLGGPPASFPGHNLVGAIVLADNY